MSDNINHITCLQEHNTSTDNAKAIPEVEVKDNPSMELVDIEVAQLKIPRQPTPVEDNSSIIIIDRDEEDRDVIRFQKTGDMKILEKVYRNRIPTLRSWANKNFYPGLIASVEDLFSELSIVFLKAAEFYDKKRGNFNTCLWNFMENRIKNIKSSKHAKKRVSENYTGPLSGMILSLDFPYSDKDGSALTLKDVIPSDASASDNFVLKDTIFDETVTVLSEDNPLFKEFLLKVSEGGSLASLMKEYKTRKGKITLSKQQAHKLAQRKSKKFATSLIRMQKDIQGDFSLSNYTIEGSELGYEIELKKTTETDNILKTIRELRKNKDAYLNKIKGLAMETVSE